MTKLAITLDALEVLDAIEKKGSFAAAANTLNRVPSAISYTIQKLEQDLGVTLFTKQGRRAVLTNTGKLLVEQGRELLLAADQLTINAKQVATGWEPRLRICVDHVVPMKTIIPLLGELYNQQPAIEVELSIEVLGGSWEALIEDRVDLLVGGADEPPGHKGIRFEPWQSFESVFIAAPNHPICHEAMPLSMEAIHRYRSVIVRDTSRNQPALSRGILNRESFMVVPSFEEKIQAHIEGLGVGTAPILRVREQIDKGMLKRLPLEKPLRPTSLCIAWKSVNRGRALSWFVDRLLDIKI